MTKKTSNDIELSAALSDLTSDPTSDELRKRGIYYITGEIDEDSLLDIHQDVLLKHLSPSWKGDIQLIINSVGGDTAQGWAFIDLLDWVRMEVRTTGLGVCLSLGAELLACGTPGKRTVAKNTSIMIHGASTWGIEGNMQQIAAAASDMKQEYERTVRFWKEHSIYKTDEEVKEKLLDGQDHYLTPEQALSIGIIDNIVTSTGKHKK